jgi:endonuclease G, mitochondrial
MEKILKNLILERAELMGEETFNFLSNDNNILKMRAIVNERHPILVDLPAAQAEAIVLLAGRPVTQIVNGTFDLTSMGIWNDVLSKKKPIIESACMSVGRFEYDNHLGLDWGGTGWIVAHGVVVTNRHVASEVIGNTIRGLEFKLNQTGRKMGAFIDFLEEYNISEEDEHSLKALYISPDDDHDYALFEFEDDGKRQPIELLDDFAEGVRDVCAIGYPAWDGRRNDPTEMARIFGMLYNVKRLAPGKAWRDGSNVLHDCSTLGGNSGSVLLDVETGKAIGLHFAGQYRKANYAVPSKVISQKLKEFNLL